MVLPQHRDGELRRQQMLQMIRSNPGIVKTDLCKQLDLAWGTVDYHLRFLAQRGYIQMRLWARRTHIFLAVEGGKQEQYLHGNQLILQALHQLGHAGVSELAKATGMGQMAIRKRMSILVAANLVEPGKQYHRRYRPLTPITAPDHADLALPVPGSSEAPNMMDVGGLAVLGPIR